MVRNVSLKIWRAKELMIENEDYVLESSDEEEKGLKIGDTVMVVARTWANMNKLGGAGRISKIHVENSKKLYDIRYLLGGSEKKVEEQYVEGADLVHNTGPSRQIKSRVFYHSKQFLFLFEK